MSSTLTSAHFRTQKSGDESANQDHVGEHERVYLPTPEEIAAECRRIRGSWSRTEQHRRRAGVTETDYSENDSNGLEESDIECTE